MSANYHGETTVRCYHDCQQAGCPSHRIRLVSKHGGYYVEQWDAARAEFAHRVDLPFDIAWIDAVARILWYEDTAISAHEARRAKLEMALRSAQAELEKDGYRPDAEPLKTIIAALKEDER